MRTKPNTETIMVAYQGCNRSGLNTCCKVRLSAFAFTMGFVNRSLTGIVVNIRGDMITVLWSDNKTAYLKAVYLERI